MNLELRDNVSSEAFKNISKWLSEPKFASYKDELEELINEKQWKLLDDAFFKVIEFGTGGRRGTTGIGSNRINLVTMGESAQALCSYAKSVDKDAAERGVVIACDTRLSSRELSEYVAGVCAANGFKTYIFDSFRSTPELSFAVRKLKAAIGIVVSASHNPPADNGFKGYWNDGGQLVAPHDKGVMAEVEKVNSINFIDYSKAVKDEHITVIGKEIDEAYWNAVVAESEGKERNLKIVYSPLHGAGQTNVLPVLRRAGFSEISLVEDQMTPDGNFPTIEGHKPNPEERVANDRAVAQMMAEDADIAITNDPDADRIGAIVRHNDRAIYLNGNQSAALATQYVLQKMRKEEKLSSSHYIAKTIVTTEMMSAIAKHFNVKIYSNMLVGFKYIGELIRAKEATDEKFVIGGEESYGLLKGDYARDKDGAVGALSLVEYAAELKLEGKTLYDELFELYRRYGLFIERLDSAYFEGASGFEKMQHVMKSIQTSPPQRIDGIKVTAVQNYLTLERTDIMTGDKTPIECVKGNVIVLELEGDARKRVTVRPSGTEPKIKLYTQWYEEPTSNLALQYQESEVRLQALSQTLEGMLLD